MVSISKYLMVTGAIVTFLGVFLYSYDQIPLIGKLKGDFVFQKGSLTIYFPLASFLLISIAVTIIMNIFRR